MFQKLHNGAKILHDNIRGCHWLCLLLPLCVSVLSQKVRIGRGGWMCTIFVRSRYRNIEGGEV